MCRFAALCALVLVACGPKSMQARMGSAEKMANEVDELLSRAEKAMGDAEPTEAEEHLRDAKKILADPDAQLYPEYEMLVSRAKEDEARLPEVRQAKERKELEKKILERKQKIDEYATKVRAAAKALEAPSVEKSTVEEAVASAKDLSEALKDGADLEKKDGTYAEFAKKQRELYEKLKDPIQLARARLDFMEGPVAFRTQAAEKVKAARKAKKPDEKRALYAEALKLYDQCSEISRKLLTANPAMSNLAINSAGKKTTPDALDTACAKEWSDANKEVLKIKAPPEPKAPPKKKK